VVQYGTLGYCLLRLWTGDILFGTMTLFLQQRSNLTSAFSSLVSLIPTALSGSVAAERVRELTQLPKEPRTNQKITVSGSCSLTLENVRVAYTDDRKVLSNVNIHIPAGKIVALVGPSGEGKTTLLRLLLGLIRPEDGEIYLEDQDGKRHFLGADTRHCFSYVPQGNTIIAGTVADNLRLGKEDATDEELRAALEAACAWSFVSKLPLGVNTPIGEGGKGLSEGQAQRISIARALIRNAPILLLDEVTSALDKTTEQKVLKNLTAKGVTTLLTTHRMTMLDRCARIYRVENGQVCEETQY
jgi:ABC-type multidrug transport system fused ATPase/permease subunit